MNTSHTVPLLLGQFDSGEKAKLIKGTGKNLIYAIVEILGLTESLRFRTKVVEVIQVGENVTIKVGDELEEFGQMLFKLQEGERQ